MAASGACHFASCRSSGPASHRKSGTRDAGSVGSAVGPAGDADADALLEGDTALPGQLGAVTGIGDATTYAWAGVTSGNGGVVYRIDY